MAISMTKEEAVRIATEFVRQLTDVEIGRVEHVRLVPAQMTMHVGDKNLMIGGEHDVWTVAFSYERFDGALDSNLIIVEVDTCTKKPAFFRTL